VVSVSQVSPQNPLHASPFPHPSYTPRPSHSSRFYHLHNSECRVECMKLLIMQLPSILEAILHMHVCAGDIITPLL
jgi:hypothetical protein